jgi:hypothetical protein
MHPLEVQKFEFCHTKCIHYFLFAVGDAVFAPVAVVRVQILRKEKLRVPLPRGRMLLVMRSVETVDPPYWQRMCLKIKLSAVECLA